MRELSVYLCFEGPAHSPPWCLDSLLALAERHKLRLEVIYNGFSLDYDQALRPLSAEYHSLRLPVRLSREALLKHLLARPGAGELCLFLSAAALWSPPDLESWLEPLARFAAISPNWAQAATVREAQALALMPSEASEIHGWLAPTLPAILAWAPAKAAPLIQMLDQPGYVLGQDRTSIAWAPPGPSVSAALDWQTAESEWAIARGGGTAAQAALERLTALSPESPALYQQGLKTTADPLTLLKRAFGHGAVSPQLLIQAQQHYRQAESPAEAEACEQLFQALYGQGPYPPEDAARESLKAFLEPYPALPRPSSLAVCLIVKDEIDTLARCLTSVSGLAAEIIVVDTGSGDGTPELATRLGARVIHAAWRNDFAAARNVSLAHASADWILVLDADEYLEPAARTLLWRFLWDPPPGLPRCQLQIDNQVAAGVGGLIHFVSRLFPRHQAFSYQGRIHESLTYQGPGLSPTPLIKGMLIQHTGYIAAVYQQKHKAERNLELLRRQQAEEPERPDWMFYLGDSLMAARAIPEAIPWLERAIQSWSEQAMPTSPLALRALIKTLQAYLATAQPARALELALRFTPVLQGLPDYWYFLGRVQLALGDESAAAEAFSRCLDVDTSKGPMAYYDPNTAQSAPLYELMQLYRRQLLQQRLSSPRALKTPLEQMLSLFPDGVWQAHQFSLFDLLAQLCLWVWRQSGELPFDWLTPYQGRLSARAAIWVLEWLSGQTSSAHADDGPVALTPDQLQAFRSSQAFRHQLCEALPQGAPWGPALREAIFAVSQLLDPVPETYLAYAGFCHQARAPLRALNVIDEACRLFPRHPVLLNNLAMLQFETGQAETALETLTACVQLHPDFLEAHENLIRIQRWQQAH